MSSFTKPNNGWPICATFEKSTNRWKTEKFNGDILIPSALGSTFDQTMIHTTMAGPEPDDL